MKEMKVYKESPVFGLDIGTRSVVGTIGYKADEKFVVIAQEIREHRTRAMLDGQIHDINRVAATIAEIKTALEKKTGLELTQVCIAAAGRVLKTSNVHIEMNYETEKVVTQEDISTLASMGVEKAFKEFQQNEDENMRFYCVGYSIVKYFINGDWMGQPEHHKAKTLAADMIATFLPDDVVDGLYSAVELAGLKVANMTLEPIAAIRIAIPERFRLLNIAMIDVGAGTSDISITNDGSITAFGMIPCAGDCITESLAKQCLVDFSTAEAIKKQASVQEEVVYEDIMGLEQTVPASEILEICQPEIEKIAKQAAAEIRNLNGGASPSAVFIVGGGGRIKGFADKIAQELELNPNRVALRGEEIMKNVDFPEEAKKDSTIVTPIGICLSSYEQNNNFIHVSFNGKQIKLYDNNKLAVMDAAIQSSFSRESLFPRRGRELRYTVNGKNRVSKGEYGESAKIYVNGETVNLNHKIKANDKIIMEESTMGKEAQVQVMDLVDYHARINIMVNGKEMELPKPIKVNGKQQPADYQIKEGDAVSLYSYYTYDQLVDYLHIIPDEAALMINGEAASRDSAIYTGDEVTTVRMSENKKADNRSENYFVKEENFSKEAESMKISQQDNTSAETVNVFKNMLEDEAKSELEEKKRLLVIVNQKPIYLEGKSSYVFVDVFDFIDFDTSRMQGAGIVTQINGAEAQYTQELKNGDKIEIYWK